jgi:hypothetical protein
MYSLGAETIILKNSVLTSCSIGSAKLEFCRKSWWHANVIEILTRLQYMSKWSTPLRSILQ